MSVSAVCHWRTQFDQRFATSARPRKRTSTWAEGEAFTLFTIRLQDCQTRTFESYINGSQLLEPHPEEQ